MFAFQTLGVMADAAEAIATDADVSLSHPCSVCTISTFHQLYFEVIIHSIAEVPVR